jgi:hypothetical protein
MQQVRERQAIAHAGIECGELRCEGKAILQSLGFRHRQGEETQLGFSMRSHRATSEWSSVWLLLWSQVCSCYSRLLVLKGGTSKKL